MKRLAIPRSLLIFGLLLVSHNNLFAQLPATLQWENLLPSRYTYLPHLFELPGRRVMHAGFVIVDQPTSNTPNVPFQKEVAFAITNASGDTVRLIRPRPMPRGTSEGIVDAVMTPTYQIITCGGQGPSASPQLSNGFMAAFDTTGRQLWFRPFPQIPNGGLVKMLAVGDGYLILTTFYRQIGGGNVTYAGLLKTDLQGNVRWQRTLESRGQLGRGRLNDFIASPDGSYLAAGICEQPGVPTSGSGSIRQNFWLLKFAPNGDTIAQASLGREDIRK